MMSYKEIYLLPFRALAAGVGIFARNRRRTKAFLKQPRVAKTIKYAMLLTLLAWLAIAFFTRDTEDDRLMTMLKNLWSETMDDKQD